MKNTVSATTTLFIKNMVCNRCIRVVREELTKLDVAIEKIELGEADVRRSTFEGKEEAVRDVLQENGFELLDDKRVRIIEQIKKWILHEIYDGKERHDSTAQFSKRIAKAIGYDYFYLSKLFSSFEGLTIEKYFILQKIERVKELLLYRELTLSEIAYELRYSSVQHLSNQFKAVTGFTPTAFRQIQGVKRQPIDRVTNTVK